MALHSLIKGNVGGQEKARVCALTSPAGVIKAAPVLPETGFTFSLFESNVCEPPQSLADAHNDVKLQSRATRTARQQC